MELDNETVQRLTGLFKDKIRAKFNTATRQLDDDALENHTPMLKVNQELRMQFSFRTYETNTDGKTLYWTVDIVMDADADADEQTIQVAGQQAIDVPDVTVDNTQLKRNIWQALMQSGVNLSPLDIDVDFRLDVASYKDGSIGVVQRAIVRLENRVVPGLYRFQAYRVVSDPAGAIIKLVTIDDDLDTNTMYEYHDPKTITAHQDSPIVLHTERRLNDEGQFRWVYRVELDPTIQSTLRSREQHHYERLVDTLNAELVNAGVDLTND